MPNKSGHDPFSPPRANLRDGASAMGAASIHEKTTANFKFLHEGQTPATLKLPIQLESLELEACLSLSLQVY